MKAIHYTRTGYNGDLTHTSICGKKVKGEDVDVNPEKATCEKCMQHPKFKVDLQEHKGEGDLSIKRRIFIESDILHADELRSAQRDAHDLADKRGLKVVDKVFSQVLNFAWHDLPGTWEAVKKADEIYAISSLLPIIGNSYTGAPVIFNGMCERAVKEGVKGKQVYILNQFKGIYWDMIDIKIMKKAFKHNELYMLDEELEIVKIDVSKIKK